MTIRRLSTITPDAQKRTILVRKKEICHVVKFPYSHSTRLAKERIMHPGRNQKWQSRRMNNKKRIMHI